MEKRRIKRQPKILKKVAASLETLDDVLASLLERYNETQPKTYSEKLEELKKRDRLGRGKR